MEILNFDGKVLVSNDSDTWEGFDFSNRHLARAWFSLRNLRGAIFRGTCVSKATFFSADLTDAFFYSADLRRAILSNACLRGANLARANLSGADLSHANLRQANLQYAVLNNAKLRYADLTGVNLDGANLCGADLYGAKGFFDLPLACPSHGSFIGWKKVDGCLVKLLIPEDAKRSSAQSRKCRCDKAMVFSITDLSTQLPVSEIENNNYKPLIYKVGEMVYPDSWDSDRWNECSHGIHFFINKDDAINYKG